MLFAQKNRIFCVGREKLWLWEAENSLASQQLVSQEGQVMDQYKQNDQNRKNDNSQNRSKQNDQNRKNDNSQNRNNQNDQNRKNDNSQNRKNDNNLF